MIPALGRLSPYRVDRDFLPDAERAALLDWALSNEASFSAAKLKRGQTNLAIRNALFVRGGVDWPWAEPLRARVMARLPVWFTAFGMAPFEVSFIELDLIAYNQGAFYRRHVDTVLQRGDGPDDAKRELPGDRIVTAVYYFHAEPKGFSGGALRLHPIRAAGPDAPYADIEPDQNSIAVFPSWAPHEVLPVECPSGAFRDSRFAVNCWVRRVRPGER